MGDPVFPLAVFRQDSKPLIHLLLGGQLAVVLEEAN
jgi:hypothetical protein